MRTLILYVVIVKQLNQPNVNYLNGKNWSIDLKDKKKTDKDLIDEKRTINSILFLTFILGP